MSASSPFKFNVSPSWNISEEKAYEFIQDITRTLAEYSWIYVTRNTNIFLNDVLEKIPIEWVEAICPLSIDEFKEVPFGFIKDDWPLSLKKFLTNVTQLAELRFPKSQDCWEENDNDISHLVGKNMPLKKQKEIFVMSTLINQICYDVRCHKVLDIGSGMGYLDQFLHHTFGILCVGVDSVKKLTDGAKERLIEDPCIRSIQHETISVQNNEDCIEELKIVLENADNIKFNCTCERYFPDDFLDSESSYESASYVMAGLHCCGKLMQDMMKIFCNMDELEAFACVGCCYNKTNINDFPMSQAALNSVNSIKDDYPDWFPCISGLRLANHATRSDMNDYTLEDLEFAENSLIFRSILEYYVKRDNINWQKPKRRARPSDLWDFQTYCDTMFQRDTETPAAERNQRLMDIYSSKVALFPRVKVLVILQILLQPLYECFVMLDRMMYFKEKSIETKVFFLWDDFISPRNMALCAYKKGKFV